jgi:hypothetical protein
MVAGEKAERAYVAARIKTGYAAESFGDRDRLFLIRDLAVKNLDVTAGLFECGGKVCQSDWLGSDGGLIKIPDRGLDEKNFHSIIFTAERAGKTEKL